MKKIVLVLGLATLFSCEKEVSKASKTTCNCHIEWQNQEYPYYINGVQYGGYWSQTYYGEVEQDFCANAYDWKLMGGKRQRKVCE